jgi:hypothetical protein
MLQFAIDISLALFGLCGFLLLYVWAIRFWMMYVNQKWTNKFNEDCMLLEVKLPREITKSPLATEVAISSLLQGGGLTGWYAQKISGNLPQWASLEIASLEGTIHFYIRFNKKYKHLVEANFYAQYPGIELVEAEDYTKLIQYHHQSRDVSSFGASYKLSKKWAPKNPETGEPYMKSNGKPYELPKDFLPIKTYVDFGLDKDPDEEFKIDPITPLLEFMGNIGKGEYFWYQVIIQDESIYNGTKWPKFYLDERTHDHLSLDELAQAYKKHVRTSGYLVGGKEVEDEYGGIKTKVVGKDADGKDIVENVTYKFKTPKAVSKKETELTFEEKEELEAINKKLSKPLALVVVRLMYTTKSGNFDGKNIQNIISFPKPYRGINSLAPAKTTDPYDYPWQKYGNKVQWRTEEFFEKYVEREGFSPHVGERKSLDDFEDRMFFSYPTKYRRIFRMFFEAFFFPFSHPHPDEVNIMNLEEVATLWHLPGQVAGTPTLPRIDSVKGNAPSNLPQ